MKTLTEKQKRFHRSTIIITSVVGAIAIGGGIGLGLYFGQEYIGPKKDYSQYSAKELEDNNIELYKDFLNTDKANYFDRYKTYELVNIGITKFENANYSAQISDGYVDAAGIIQTVSAFSSRDGNKFFNESISASSLLSIAKRFYQESNNVDIYLGSATSGKTANWDSNSKSSFSSDEFESSWGKTLTRSSIYIISKITTLETSTKEKTEDGYKVKLDLDPTLSVLRYIKQMKSMSDLSRYPEFYSVSIEFYLDEDLNLVKSSISENYDVWKFGKHNSNGYVDITYETYTSSQSVLVPGLSENCVY